MNDRAVVALGKIYKNELQVSEEWELYTENMFPGSPHIIISPVFTININANQTTVSFTEIDVSPYDERSYKKYAYRKGASNGGDITVTTKFGAFDDAVNYRNKKVDTILNNVFTKSISIGELIKSPEKEILILIKNEWMQNVSEINKKLYDTYESLDKEAKKKCGLSIIVQKGPDSLFVADFEIFRTALVKDATQGLSEFGGVVSEGFNNICSICLTQKEHLHGFASPFKYYTVDKKGYISNYFSLKLAWKNYPICDECAEGLYLGARMIEEELNFYFYGKPYMAIPRLLIDDEDRYLEVFDAFRQFRNSERNAQSAYEDELMTFVAEQKNYFNLDLIFFTKNLTTGAIRLKSHIEEVFPSRFNKIFVEAREAVDNHPTFLNHLRFEETKYEKETGTKKEKKEIFTQKFRFGKLLQFFDKEDYSIIQSVFDGNTIDKATLYNNFIEYYRENYRKKLEGSGYQSLRKTIIDAISVINYLAYLKLISIEPLNYEVVMDSDNESVKKEGKFELEKLQSFVHDNPEFFDQKYKVGIFCLGVLVQMVMNIQQANLKNTPFEKKLKGFHLSAKDVETVYVEALAKLQQYQGNYAYGTLRKFMTEYFNLEMPAIKKASTAEISFYFVTGMESQFVFKTLTQTGEDHE